MHISKTNEICHPFRVSLSSRLFCRVTHPAMRQCCQCKQAPTPTMTPNPDSQKFHLYEIVGSVLGAQPALRLHISSIAVLWLSAEKHFLGTLWHQMSSWLHWDEDYGLLILIDCTYEDLWSRAAGMCLAYGGMELLFSPGVSTLSSQHCHSHNRSPDPHPPTEANAVVTLAHPVFTALTYRRLFCFFSNWFWGKSSTFPWYQQLSIFCF